MNNKDQSEVDILKKYINPDRIEKAPEGFTSKTMTRIRIETQSSDERIKLRLRSRVPVISVLITAVLITAALVIPASQSHSIGSALLGSLENLIVSFVQINLPPLREIDLPGWFTYGLIGIFILLFFDKALSSIFNRQKK